jgi:hypothetical protein
MDRRDISETAWLDHVKIGCSAILRSAPVPGAEAFACPQRKVFL